MPRRNQAVERGASFVEYGAETFESKDGTGHSDYFDNPKDPQMEHMGEVIAGDR